MASSLFLAKLFGLYFIIVGIIFVFRRKSFVHIVSEFGNDRALFISLALLELVAGLTLTLSHNIWEWTYRGVITFFGWWMIVEGLLYLVLPFGTIKKFIKSYNKPVWYISGGIIAVVIGVFLVRNGFGWF